MNRDNYSAAPAAGAPGVEITPAMIEAGYRVLCNSGIADEYLGADRLLVSEIFVAMYRAMPASASRPDVART